MPLEALHDVWCAALEAAAAGRVRRAAGFPAGYEHAYETTDPTDRRLVVVCPWHWRQYSHYQFWELAAVPFLARAAGYRDCVLLTNDARTAWCLPALRRLFGAVDVGRHDAAAGAALARLARPPAPPDLPSVRPPGPVLLGDLDAEATTVGVKRRLADAHEPQLVRGGPVAAALPGVNLRPPFVTTDGETLVVAKAFRNPDPTHEAKMLAGRGYLCPADRRLVVVVDGRPGDTLALVAGSGATVCTPDRLEETLGAGGTASATAAAP